MMSTKKANSGFTLIEILVVIGLIAILAAIVLIAINPSRQFAQAHNSQRTSNVEAILNAIGQNMADNKGVFTCNSGGSAVTLPTTAKDITSAAGANNVDLGCLVPTYLPAMPVDPVGLSGTCTPAYATSTSYETCYSVARDAASNRITVAATYPELGQTISITR